MREPEPALLLLVADREPVLEQDDAVLDQQPLEDRALLQEPPVLLGRAEAHDVLDAGAVVPAAVEQDDLAGGGQVLDVALEVPLRRARARSACGSATMRATRGLRCSVIRLIAPPLPAASRPSKTTTTRSPAMRTHSCIFTSSACSRSSSPRRRARHPRRPVVPDRRLAPVRAGHVYRLLSVSVGIRLRTPASGFRRRPASAGRTPASRP